MVKAVAVVTVSDSCFKNICKDTSGPSLAEFVKELFPEANLHTIIIPDEKEIIERELKYFTDEEKVELVLTTGGTGLSPRDVTPEATKAVIHREAPAISVAMTIESLKKTPMAMLSRSMAGVRDNTLIINFPGSRKAVLECIEIIKPVLSHAISLIKNDVAGVRSIHDSMQGHVCLHRGHGSNVDMTKVALRPRESPYPMLEMKDAFKILDDIMGQWPEYLEVLPTGDALGRVVAERLCAKEPMPPFAASVKDGYACLHSDGAGVRRVRSVVTAGDAPVAPLSAGECARVNTGAALPSGADCVVQVEDTKLISATEDGQTELEVEIMVAPTLNQDVRPIGSDIPIGTVLIEKGDILDSGRIGILAGAGHLNIAVYANPKVALMSTGNELQEPSDVKLRPAHIRDSNRTMLKALLREQGFESIDCGIARDEPSELVSAISSALARADILVCTGGVSMGERDLLKPVLLKDFGAMLHFGRVRMKPGKPTTFATCQVGGKNKYIFALPGNPVSAYVCCLLFVVRALRVCTRAEREFPRMRVKLAHATNLDPRPEYARATLHFPQTDELPTATLLGNQCSSRLLSTCGTSVLVELPGRTEGVARLPANTLLPALLTPRAQLTATHTH